MKKIISFIITLVMICTVVSFKKVAFAEEKTSDFGSTFFPTGKIDTISEMYYQIVKNENNQIERIIPWITQPEKLMSMFEEKETLEYEQWMLKYNIRYDCYIQIDCKIDDGQYQYKECWDQDEYQDELPYFMIYSPKISIDESKKMFSSASNLLDANYANNETGFVSTIIKGNETDGFYFDFENHSLTFRARYYLKYETEDGYSEPTYLYSDWSSEVVLGKNTTQVELQYPEKIVSPIISNLSFVEGEKDTDGTIRGTWKVYVEFPEAVLNADKYYIIIEDAFEPLSAVIQYRVFKDGNWGKWENSYWGNSNSLVSGWKTFNSIGVDNNDAIEFRVYVENFAEEGKNSEYSTSLYCNADKINTTTEQPVNPIEPSDGKTPEIKNKCKVCGICPIQPLGICLFIWILIIIIIIVVIAVIMYVKNKQNNEEKDNKNK